MGGAQFKNECKERQSQTNTHPKGVVLRKSLQKTVFSWKQGYYTCLIDQR